MKPLRRRVMRVVAQWVADVEGQDRPALYEALLVAMNERDDLCIQVSMPPQSRGKAMDVLCIQGSMPSQSR
jgi:DNA-binding protein Fis